MALLEIFLIGIGLAMDAFAVSVCKGLSMKKLEIKNALIIGVYFGFFQGVMPAIGYLLGTSFESFITRIDHWIAFILLALIGGKMIKDATCKCEESTVNDDMSFKTMLVLSMATSIDALAIGITFAFLSTNITVAALVIGIVTFILSSIGVAVGNKFGSKYEIKAEFIGGVILIIIGLKILLEHLCVINI